MNSVNTQRHGTSPAGRLFGFNREYEGDTYMTITRSARLMALMKTLKTSLKLPALVVLFFVVNIPVGAVAPHPKVIEKLRAEGKLEAFYQREVAARRAGVNAPSADPLRTPGMLLKSDPEKFRTIFGQAGGLGRSASSAAGAIDTVNVLVILVDFSDNPHNASVGSYVSNVSATPQMFDSVLFSAGSDSINNPTGSMTDYYMETSYGTFLIEGVITGWHRMPRRNPDGSISDGTTNFGTNARDLAFDAVMAARNAGINFSLFDRFGPNGVPDGQMDGVFIIHAGTGSEESHADGLFDIRSHKWNLRSPLNFDGVDISAYTMEPEETYIGRDISPIGVFCHEYGHFLGLPDLYDTDGLPSTSEGLGSWSIMASGNFLGQSKTPASYDCWSKSFVGFLEPVDVTANMRSVQLPVVNTNPVCYPLHNNSLPAGEYFLVENRQKVGFDLLLPGSGLLIYHVDQAFNTLLNNNDNQDRYLVALEQADGLNQLAFGANNPGDGSDPFSTTYGFPEFHDLTVPSSQANDGPTTQIAVWDISASGPSMTANLDISFSRPYLDAFQGAVHDRSDGDGTIESGETFEVTFSVRNLWATGVGAYVLASSPNSDLTFTVDSIHLGNLPGMGALTNGPAPFEFTVNNSITPRIDSVYLDFVSDGGLNVIREGFQVEVGEPQALIVNADQNGKYSDLYAGDLFNERLPYRTHVNQVSGLPSSAELGKFPVVIWYYGDHSLTPPTSAEKQLIKTYLNGGGRLLLSGMNLAEQFGSNPVDSVFMHNYLHAIKSIQKYDARQRGVSGSHVGNGFNEARVFGNGGAKNWTPISSAYAITPVGGAQPEFKGFLTTDPDAFHVISYSGNYRLVFFSLPFEAIEQNDRAAQLGRTQRDEILRRALLFLNDIQTDV
ncbi:MAG: M6 family metalloprotease domain-containing protein, partial [Candidatus Zixiibacteriota bacterium]